MTTFHNKNITNINSEVNKVKNMNITTTYYWSYYKILRQLTYITHNIINECLSSSLHLLPSLTNTLYTIKYCKWQLANNNNQWLPFSSSNGMKTVSINIKGEHISPCMYEPTISQFTYIVKSQGIGLLKVVKIFPQTWALFYDIPYHFSSFSFLGRGAMLVQS